MKSSIKNGLLPPKFKKSSLVNRSSVHVGSINCIMQSGPHQNIAVSDWSTQKSRAVLIKMSDTEAAGPGSRDGSPAPGSPGSPPSSPRSAGSRSRSNSAASRSRSRSRSKSRSRSRSGSPGDANDQEPTQAFEANGSKSSDGGEYDAVSYTHLTLPTIYSV